MLDNNRVIDRVFFGRVVGGVISVKLIKLYFNFTLP